MSASQRLGWTLAILGVAAFFLFRGPLRAISSSSDLRGPYAAACAWKEGANPYDSAQLKSAFMARGGSARPVQFLHPPGVIIPMLPFTWLNWDQTKMAFAFFNTAVIGLLYWGLIALNPSPSRKNYRTWLALLIGIYAPVHTGIQLGQLSVSAIAFGVAGLALLTKQRLLVSGILFGLSFTLKPQIGLVLVVYLAFTGRWKTFAAALVICMLPLVASSVGFAKAGLSIDDVKTGWQQSLSETNSVKGGERFSTANKARGNLLNLHVLLHGFLDDSKTISIAVPLIVLVLCLLWWFLYLSRWRYCPETISASIPIILSLLIIYHRTYDAIVLLIPLSWAIAAGNQFSRILTGTVMVSTMAFVIPGGAIISWAQTRGNIPESVMISPAWNTLIVAHGSLMLVLCAVALLGLMLVIPKNKPIPATQNDPE